MDQKVLVRTDTATIVLFDPELLREKLEEDADWWTGDGDLDAEERKGALVYIDTGSDGYYWVVISDTDLGTETLKEASLRVGSGILLFGAGECLPAEGVAVYDEMGRVELEPGPYGVVVSFPEEGERGIPQYRIGLRRTA